jgi:hypothetical protein
MESTTLIKLKSLEPYRHLFPKALATDTTIKKGAGVSDTVAFIPMVVKKCRWQVEAYVNLELQGLNTFDACEKLWHFVKQHIAYEKDERGIEQVRSPRRLIHDAKGDCDCFTTFIDTCLSVLNIPTINRITKYKENFFQHIYPIVPIGNGNYITMDCVVDNFNYEEPYTEKKDYNMDLQFLDGIDDEKLNSNVDAQDLFGWEDEIGDLGKGKLFSKKASTSAMPQGNQGGQSKKKGFQKFKTIAKRTLNVANKANPATALLRAGILASMKLNIMKVPQRLKWAYLSEQEAQQKGADMSKFDRLKKVLYKIEQIFYTAGGKPENLKKAILTGRGNRNKEVNGLGYLQDYESNVSGMSEYTNLSTLLGTHLYHDEFVSGLEGTEGLGSAVATSAAIASATTVMGTIAALLKSIGNLFPNKKAHNDFKDAETNPSENGSESSTQSASQNEDTTTNTNENSSNENKATTTANQNRNENTSETSNSSTSTTTNDSTNNSTNSNNSVPATNASNEVTTGNETENNAAARSASKENTTTETSNDTKKGGFKEFWEKNKKWMKPVGIGLGTATILYLGYRALKKEKGTAPAKKPQASLNGISRKKKKTKGKSSQHKNKKQNIALM